MRLGSKHMVADQGNEYGFAIYLHIYTYTFVYWHLLVTVQVSMQTIAEQMLYLSHKSG